MYYHSINNVCRCLIVKDSEDVVNVVHSSIRCCK